MKAYVEPVLALLRQHGAKEILDAPSGAGWLANRLDSAVAVDGVDLYASAPGYRQLLSHDLDRGLPDQLGTYDAVVSCEGIEHLTNPGLLLGSAKAHLRPGGLFIVTTPNAWYPVARLKYLFSGFFPGFPALPNPQRGTHMHLIAWTWPLLYSHLALARFHEITLHPCIEPERIRLFDRLFVPLLRGIYRRKAKRAGSEEEQRFWLTCASDGALLARRLVISGVAR